MTTRAKGNVSSLIGLMITLFFAAIVLLGALVSAKADTPDRDVVPPPAYYDVAAKQTGKVARRITKTVEHSADEATDMGRIAARYIGASARDLGMKSSQWCAEFANMVRRKAGYQTSGSNFAKHQVFNAKHTTPRPGTIAVMGRRGGGHTCIVTYVSASHIQCISGNSRNRRVAVSHYPRNRIYTFVLPHAG